MEWWNAPQMRNPFHLVLQRLPLAPQTRNVYRGGRFSVVAR